MEMAIGAVGCKHTGFRFHDFMETWTSYIEERRASESNVRTSDLFLGAESCVFGVGSIRVKGRGRHFVEDYSPRRGFIGLLWPDEWLTALTSHQNLRR